ncbi:hypothetical protein MRQ36_21725 [Micromonospora sp. R77]|uniref:hypothetical protein n=1 Tax=Micromonospora sp. R77 TaxID=2925836 RepID=UPI001F6150B6|nr:hypothetical protein [Micromonospora sp. R77]MCI4065039.1 hypothetical protein [Micromonospora sp. R77]
MFKPEVVVRFAGEMNQDRLDALRSALSLRRTGRLGDDWDEIFGDRSDDVPGGRLMILLIRDDSDGTWKWKVKVSSEDGVEVSSFQHLEDEVRSAVESVGLQVTGVWRRT